MYNIPHQSRGIVNFMRSLGEISQGRELYPRLVNAELNNLTEYIMLKVREEVFNVCSFILHFLFEHILLVEK